MKTPSLDTKQLLRTATAYVKPIAIHFYFAYIMILIAAVGVSVYFVSSALSMSDEEYLTEKRIEFTRDARLGRDQAVADKVLRLETANAGPIQPNYVPSRDNPFVE